jgi:hypothetical protein
MRKLNYDIKSGDVIKVAGGFLHANISIFSDYRSEWQCIVEKVATRARGRERVYCKGGIIFDMQVAAYFNGTHVNDDSKSHNTENRTEYLPDINIQVLVKLDRWMREVRELWCIDFITTEDESGLRFGFYPGGAPLCNVLSWRAILDD